MEQKSLPDFNPCVYAACIFGTDERHLFRTAALLLHAAANFIVVSWLTGFDITGSWFSFTGFIFALLVLLYLFIRHLVSFIYFLKKQTK